MYPLISSPKSIISLGVENGDYINHPVFISMIYKLKDFSSLFDYPEMVYRFFSHIYSFLILTSFKSPENP